MQNEEQLTDSENWLAFINGSKGAYENIYKKYAKAMYMYGLHITTDKELIEDAIHDVFVKLYNNRHRLPAEVNNIKFYLFVSLKNTLYNHLNKNQDTFRLNITEDVLSLSYSSVEEELIENEQIRQNEELVKLLNEKLSSRQQQIIYYRFVEQLSYKEIAILMEINMQSAKNLMQSSLAKLRSVLSGVIRFILFTFLLYQ
ncbi:RNA polymerase sigma factor (sigma-70 family) [Dysgonomonas hofstadii]|uniref:RNA polymerase sigma factor (Sigma-70 family) n=1 Tax=Dysgonomonas hofstadii TaxID=637886 RepID=A0A840CM27_9BACT|nr:sigma-70 family RNA polymerase sigma factor [Dysgonomonas hofstadii]MBB4037050.1 RNA polymerase sigma factor (sigma-70 family) [Dysgonomonas hofstadii]